MAIVLGLGTNLGNRLAALQAAREHLRPILHAMVSAPVYETAPLYVTDQPHFLNTIVMGETIAPPYAFLHTIKDIERSIGRKVGLRYGPREIDIDIIYYDDKVMNEPDLSIPHPLRLERHFVLKPLADIAPDLIDPVVHMTVRELLAKLPPDPTIKTHAQSW